MGMILDYGQRTIQIAPIKTVTTTNVATGTTTRTLSATSSKQIASAIKTITTAPIPTTIKIPLASQAGVTTTPVKTGIMYPLIPALPIVQFLGEITNAISPLPKPEVKPGVYRSVTPVYSPGVKEAVVQAAQRKMGLSIVQTPKAQQIISLARSVDIVKNISAQGYELAPKGTKEYLGIAETQAAQFRDEVNAYRGLQEEWSTKQAGYLSTLSQQEKLLATAASEGAVAKGQLNLLTTDYNTLMQKYQELLNQPPGTTPTLPELPDIFGGLKDWIAKYGILAVGGVILIIVLIVVMSRK